MREVGFVFLLIVVLGGGQSVLDTYRDTERVQACYSAAGRAPDPVAAASRMRCADIGTKRER